MSEKVLKKLRDFRLRLQAEIAEMESYGIDVNKRKEKLNKILSEPPSRPLQRAEMTLINTKRC